MTKEKEENGKVDEQHVRDMVGVMTEAQVAVLYGCGVRSLRNRARDDLPPYFKAGGKRLFFKEDVVKYFKGLTG